MKKLLSRLLAVMAGTGKDRPRDGEGCDAWHGGCNEHRPPGGFYGIPQDGEWDHEHDPGKAGNEE